jgi:hypothetical protein
MDNKTIDTPATNLSDSADAGPADLISNATKAAERLENANKELAKLLAIQQQMQVKRTLDGHADTGIKQESQDEKEMAEAKRFLTGTGLEDYAFPSNQPKD